MKKRQSWGIAFTYVGAVVGAGFSSGQEIWHFFARHQANGLLGVILVGISFTVLGPILFQLGKVLDIESYHRLFYNFLPAPLPLLFDLIYGFFLLGSVSVMLAGSGVVFSNLLGFPYFTGVLVAFVFVLVTLYLKVEGIFVVNGLLIPFLLLTTIITVVNYLSFTGVEQFKTLLIIKPVKPDWLIDALLYVSYNLVIAVAAMTGLVYREEREDIIRGSSWGGGLLFLLNLIIFMGLITAFHSSPQEEIPMFYLALKGGKAICLSYILALYFAMVSTAIANYYAFTRRLISLIKIKYESGLLISGLFVLPLVLSGFSTLVEKLYPLFGYLGFYILGYFFILYLREKVFS